MSKFLTVAFIAAFFTLSISSVQAQPKRNCTTISKAQYKTLTRLYPNVSKSAVVKILGESSCKIDGYADGLTAYGYNLNYEHKNWLVVLYKNGKAQSAKTLPYGMGLRKG